MPKVWRGAGGTVGVGEVPSASASALLEPGPKGQRAHSIPGLPCQVCGRAIAVHTSRELIYGCPRGWSDE